MFSTLPFIDKEWLAAYKNAYMTLKTNQKGP